MNESVGWVLFVVLCSSQVLEDRSNKMMGGSETVGGAKDGVQAIAIHVPIGWQRRLEGGQVLYIR